MALLSLAHFSTALFTLVIGYRVYWEATTGATRRKIKQKYGCQPPKRWWSWDPILGFDWVIGNFKAYSQHKLLEYWTSILRQSNAHTVSLYVVGKTIFLTNDPENIKTILATDFSIWSLGKPRMEQMTAYVGRGIFTNEGTAWKHSRELLRPSFNRSQVSDFHIFEKHTARMIERIPKDGATVELEPLFHLLTLAISTEFLFGRSTSALDDARKNEEVEQFIDAFEYCQNPFENANTRKWGWRGALLPDLRQKKCAKIIEDIDEEVTLKRTQTSGNHETERYVFLEELLAVTDDRTQIRSELLNILSAGRGTTACLLTNFFFELPRHSQILARLRMEIKDSVGVNPPTYEQVKELKYLKAVVNETQRLYPVGPINTREALQDTIIPHGGGPSCTNPVLVPKGAYVAYNTYAMQRRKDIFGPDAESFNPSRWLENEHPSSPLRPGWAYLPFSGGPRVCLGQQFALTEASCIIVRLLQAFQEVESRDEEPWREKLTIVCSSLGGCKVGFRQ
ncbi:putative P450 monooxygenase [Sporormia fimetaria CBS 119925]|uniref:Putative P450 monooxygenase n=1 Tax=Sporormia fimetaria CBS 119925 TaxID=1340428 RepID=A0A6A6UWC8_9PLEO|nr:putative P450 monooxygenase [Sporormia fimetaria CBS 119925]